MIKLGDPKRIVMAGVTLGCALGIGYFMQLSVNQDSASASEAPQIDSDAFARAFVGGAPQAAENDVEVPVENKIADAAGYEDAEATPLNTEAGKVQLFEAAADEAEQSFDAGGLQVEDVTLTSAEPVPPASAPQPEALPNAPLEMAALQDMAPIGELPREEKAPVLACDDEIVMTVSPAAAAMVQLDLTAPCLAEAQFTLHHNGMMFSGLTDETGAWSMEVPALTRNAVFIAAFDNGEGAVANAVVDTLDQYDRYVLQWKGQSGLQIHAMEYGADYGEDGHVWHEAARDETMATKGEGGFLLRLGEGVLEDTVLMAEVYTFPTQTAQRDGQVEVSLETEISAANCGRDIEAQALIKPGAGEIDARDLTMAIPDCTAVGDFLVLKNLYEDLKIARN